MMDYQIIETVATLGTAAATIALVFLLYKTLKQMESTVKLSQIQTKYRFRPWIGSSAQFQQIIPSINEKIQFEITLKNFGEIPASGVTAKCSINNKRISREEVISNPNNTFELGPMLPNMEKKYWFFIEQAYFSKVSDEKEKMFTAVYFEYDTDQGKSGYGIISEYIAATKTFVHYDMWIEGSKTQK